MTTAERNILWTPSLTISAGISALAAMPLYAGLMAVDRLIGRGYPPDYPYWYEMSGIVGCLIGLVVAAVAYTIVQERLLALERTRRPGMPLMSTLIELTALCGLLGLVPILSRAIAAGRLADLLGAKAFAALALISALLLGLAVPPVVASYLLRREMERPGIARAGRIYAAGLIGCAALFCGMSFLYGELREFLRMDLYPIGFVYGSAGLFAGGLGRLLAAVHHEEVSPAEA